MKKSQEQINFEKKCDDIGLTIDIYNKKTELEDGIYTIVGVNNRMKNYKVIIEDVNGNQYNAMTKDVISGLIK